jgi:hypothetical protein
MTALRQFYYSFDGEPRTQMEISLTKAEVKRWAVETMETYKNRQSLVVSSERATLITIHRIDGDLQIIFRGGDN